MPLIPGADISNIDLLFSGTRRMWREGRELHHYLASGLRLQRYE